MASSYTFRRRFLHVIALLGAAVPVCGAALPAYGANNCPWMSEATASSLLGGDATGAYVAGTERKPAMCTFTQQNARGLRSLQITVEVVGDPQARLAQAELTCGPNPDILHAIGNEASFCTGEQTEPHNERVIGRVRDQLFGITLSTSVKDDAILTREALKARIYTASEQVAGNLF